MIGFRPDIKIVAIDSSYTDNTDTKVSLYFNTKSMDTIISTKQIFELIFMLTGLFDAEDVTTRNTSHNNLNVKGILNDLFCRELLCEFSKNTIDARLNYIDRLNKRKFHFTNISNIDVIVALFLNKLGASCVFYKDAIITDSDISQNIYYDHSAATKNISSLLQEIDVKDICFKSSPFDVSTTHEMRDIVINSNHSDWVDSEEVIVINTWSYLQSDFGTQPLFSDKRFTVSDDLKPLVSNFILALRVIDDILYSVGGGQYS